MPAARRGDVRTPYIDMRAEEREEAHRMQQLENDIKALIISSLALEDITPADIDSDEPLFVKGLGLDSIDALELGGCPHRGCLCAAAAECREVLRDVALEGEDAYPKDGQFPLSGRSCSVPGGAGFASFAHL